MSKANLLIYKRTPGVNIANKQKAPSQHTITHRDVLKEDDSQKLYTFCSSEQKQACQPPEEDSRDISRQRKISLNNNKGKVYQPLSKSKGKNISQVNIQKDRKKDLSSYTIVNNNSSILNTSALVDRRKTDKLTIRDDKKEKEDNRINISINLSKNCFNEPTNKENKYVINNIHEKTDNQKKILSQMIINKEKDGVNQGGKKMIVMSEQELHNFTKKQASDKVRLEQKIQKLQEGLKSFEQKQSEWKLFKKDSQEYIKYLVKQKQTMLSHCQSLQEEVSILKSDNQYHHMAKEEYRCTIHEQETEIHEMKQSLEEAHNEIGRLHEQLERQEAERQAIDRSAPLQMLEIQNSHLKKQLQISEKHQSVKISHRFEIENLQKQMQDLRLANEILSSQIKENYIFKLKCDVFQKTLEQSSNSIAKLTQENESLRNKLRDKYKSSKVDKNSEVGDFQFRLDTSPHSPSEVEVVWKRDCEEEKENYSRRSRVHDYFDHDFFSGITKSRI